MRGTLLRLRCAAAGLRFIPAHAGNTGNVPPARIKFTVHPRACGEHVLRRVFKLGKAGSSPRMRGTPRKPLPVAVQIRFIPAHAGNTDRRIGSWRKCAVHPRACGEHIGEYVATAESYGSSPRMRGTLIGEALANIGKRFIPAHAGNTFTRSKRATAISVHPRACGEH